MQASTKKWPTRGHKCSMHGVAALRAKECMVPSVRPIPMWFANGKRPHSDTILEIFPPSKDQKHTSAKFKRTTTPLGRCVAVADGLGPKSMGFTSLLFHLPSPFDLKTISSKDFSRWVFVAPPFCSVSSMMEHDDGACAPTTERRQGKYIKCFETFLNTYHLRACRLGMLKMILSTMSASLACMNILHTFQTHPQCTVNPRSSNTTTI